MRIFVVIATLGRPEITAKTVDSLYHQSRPADGVVVVSVSESDVVGVRNGRVDATLLLSERGLCRQRNTGLQYLQGKADVIIFLDDDFIMETHYIENVERIFTERLDVVGITGELIADGINSGGISFDAARALVEAATLPDVATERPRKALYGCNMVIRAAAADGLSFDEQLPLYGWQEDIDYTYQLARRGLLISTTSVAGVHMGVSGGRTSGVRLGYSQVANVVYLARKGTVPAEHWRGLVLGNLAANLVRSIRPEPNVDRRGRLKGNVLAMIDLVRGRIHPGRILSM